MRRFLLSTLAILGFAAAGTGCQNVARIGGEFKNLYADIQRNFFGIDYPNGLPEFSRDKYIDIPAPGIQPVTDD